MKSALTCLTGRFRLRLQAARGECARHEPPGVNTFSVFVAFVVCRRFCLSFRHVLNTIRVFCLFVWLLVWLLVLLLHSFCIFSFCVWFVVSFRRFLLMEVVFESIL